MSEIGEGALQQMTFSIKWKIERFFANCTNVGDSYKSATFPIRHANQIINWYLEVCPRGIPEGNDDEGKDFIALYLYHQSENILKVTVDYKFSIVSDKSNLFFQDTKTFEGLDDSWGSGYFVKQDIIKDAKSGALINDTLTILCEITFHQTDTSIRSEIKEYERLLNNIGKGFQNYEQLLESNHYSDVTFNIQDKKLYLHKAILMCQNSVFKAMFEHEMKENKESLVDITDVDFSIMKELFRFIYSGKVENIEKIVKDLLIAADKYCVIELKALCEKTLYHSLAAENAIEYLKLTEKCDTLHLKNLVIEFIVDNLKDIVEKPNFNLLFAALDREVVCEVVKALAEKDRYFKMSDGL